MIIIEGFIDRKIYTEPLMSLSQYAKSGSQGMTKVGGTTSDSWAGF